MNAQQATVVRPWRSPTRGGGVGLVGVVLGASEGGTTVTLYGANLLSVSVSPCPL